MDSLRSFCRLHGGLAALIFAMALALKALIPGGYMISSEGGFAIVPCASVFTLQPAPEPAAHHAHHAHHAGMDHAAMAHQATAASGVTDADHDSHAAAHQACPYAVLSLASLGGADPVLLAGALAFVLALGFAPLPIPELARPVFLRPQLRGPPLPS